MGIFTRGKVWISTDKATYIEYDPGTGEAVLVVDGVTVLTGTAAAGVDLSALTINEKFVPHGDPVANIAEPTGGETEDAEARAAIADILEALEAFGIMEAGEGE